MMDDANGLDYRENDGRKEAINQLLAMGRRHTVTQSISLVIVCRWRSEMEMGRRRV